MNRSKVVIDASALRELLNLTSEDKVLRVQIFSDPPAAAFVIEGPNVPKSKDGNQLDIYETPLVRINDFDII